MSSFEGDVLLYFSKLHFLICPISVDDFDGNYAETFGNSTNFARSPFGGDCLGSRLAGREKKAPTVLKFVDCQAIQMGMKRLAFLMDCCHPANIPDPPFIAAALQLVSFSGKKVLHSMRFFFFLVLFGVIW